MSAVFHMHKGSDTTLLLGSAMLSHGTTGLNVTVEYHCAANVSKHTEPGFRGLQSKAGTEV